MSYVQPRFVAPRVLTNVISAAAACLLALAGCAHDVEGAAAGGSEPQGDRAQAGAGALDALTDAERRLDLDDRPVDGVDDGEVGSVDQALWHVWSQPRGVRIVGIARAFNTRFAYIWYADGKVCNTARSDGNVFCGSALANYAAPDDPANIAAIGFAMDTGHTYTWYLDSTVSHGVSNVLDRHNGKRTFTRPINPDTGAAFSMAQLIDADNSNNGKWYYYWLSHTGRVWRTTGDSRNAANHTGPTSVVVQHEFMPILGISFSNRVDIGAPIETWYATGNKNFSNTSLNLAKND